MGSPVPRAKKQLTSGDTTFTFPSAEGGSGKLNSALSGGSGKGLGMGKKTSLTDLSILAGGNNVSLSSARESVKEAMNGAVTNAVQMVHNLAPEFTPRIGGFNSTGVNSSSSSSANSSSSVGSTGGAPAGGPFALSHGPPGASTAHLMGAPGGGSGHFSSVSALRAKKQPPQQPQGGSAIMVSACAMLSLRSVLRLSLLSSMHLMWTAKFDYYATLVTLQTHCLFTLPI
jgi:hypothetical protein